MANFSIAMLVYWRVSLVECQGPLSALVFGLRVAYGRDGTPGDATIGRCHHWCTEPTTRGAPKIAMLVYNYKIYGLWYF